MVKVTRQGRNHIMISVGPDEIDVDGCFLILHDKSADELAVEITKLTRRNRGRHTKLDPFELSSPSGRAVEVWE